MYKHIRCGIAMGLLASVAIASEPAKRLGGRVVDENGRPLAGAKVTAFGAEAIDSDGSQQRKLGTAVTGADGRFRFDRPAESVVTIVATKKGGCLDWAYWLGEGSGEPVLRLGPATTIEGQIVDEAGRPIAGAAVDALFKLGVPDAREMYAPLPGGALTAKTDVRGRFRFATVPQAATVAFDISAPGHARAFTEVHFTPGQKGLRFVLPPEGRLEGAVVDKATGRPLADIHLSAVGSVTSGVHQARAITDKQGRFRMAGLTGGKYEIEIVGAGRALPQWLGSKEKVAVKTGKVTSADKIEAVKGGTLELVLTDTGTGKPITVSASVWVCPGKGTQSAASHVTSRNGVARVYLRPGNYIARVVYATGYPHKREKVESFRVEVGKTRRGALVMTGVPKVPGIVRDFMGIPVPGAKIRVLGAARDIVAGNDGRFAISSADVGPLFCFLLVRHPRQNMMALWGAGKETKTLEIRLFPPAKVSGVVLDSQARPVAGVSVQAQISASHFGRYGVVATARTNKDGRYQMDLAVTATDYVIIAKAAGCSPAEVAIPQRQFAEGKGKIKDLVLHRADRTIRGVVRDDQGKPVPGVIISAEPERGPKFPAVAVTDDKGRFTLEHLSKCPVIRLYARAPGRGWVGHATIRAAEKDAVIRVAPSHWD